MRPLTFHKMHGAGNDFVLIDARGATPAFDPGWAAGIADRRRGVGCDQLLVLRDARDASRLLRYEIWNADGSPAGQCGNGARCVGLFLERNGETASEPFTLESPSGPVTVQVLEGENAIRKNRDLMGATDPKQAEKGTIRADFAESIDANAVHGSDSPETAAFEVAYFFPAMNVYSR